MGVIMRNGIAYGNADEDVSIVTELPEIGQINHLYIVSEEESLYYWDGEKYVKVINNQNSQTGNINAEKSQIIIGNGENWAEGSSIKIENGKTTKMPVKRYDHIDGNSFGNWSKISLILDNEKTESNERQIFVIGKDSGENFIIRAEDTAAFTMLNNSTFITEGNTDVRFQNSANSGQRTSLLMKGDVNAKIGDDIVIGSIKDIGTSVNITDGAKVNICGWLASMDNPVVPNKDCQPFVKIAGKSRVIIENGLDQAHIPKNWRLMFPGSSEFNVMDSGPSLVMHQDAIALFEGNSLLKLDDNANAIFQDESILQLSNEATMILAGGAGILMNGIKNAPAAPDEYPPVSETRQPRLIMNSGAQIVANGDETGDPYLMLNGAGGILSNGGGLLVLEDNGFIIGGGYKGSFGLKGSTNGNSNLLNDHSFYVDFQQSFYPPQESDNYKFSKIVKKATENNENISPSDYYFLQPLYNWKLPSNYKHQKDEKSVKSRTCVDNEKIQLLIEAYKEKGTTITEQTIKNKAITLYNVKKDKFQELVEAMGVGYCNISSNDYGFQNEVNNLTKKTGKTLAYFYDTYWGLRDYNDISTYENYCKKKNLVPYLPYNFLRIFNDSTINTAKYCKIDPYSYIEEPKFELNGKTYFYDITQENLDALNQQLDSLKKIPFEFLVTKETTNEGDSFYKITQTGIDTFSAYFDTFKAPLVNIKDNVKIHMGTSDDAYVWVKISSDGVGSQTNVIHIDNSHTETRQNSILSLRGKTQGEYGQADFPYKPVKNGSMLTMYGESRFVMRDIWQEYTGIDTGSLTFYTDDITPATTVEELFETSRAELDKNLAELNRVYVSSDGDTLRSQTLSNGKVKYTLSNYKWQSSIPMRMPKEEGSPLMEVIENAEFRMEGNSIIKTTSDGILINGVEFTNEQLRKLLELIN